MRSLLPAGFFVTALLGLTACAGVTTPAATTEEPPAEEPSTCAQLIPEVIRISEESDQEITLLQIYKPVTVQDDQAKYKAGELKVPDGETTVDVLKCTGTAAWSDSSQGEVAFSMQFDLNGDSFIAYEAI